LSSKTTPARSSRLLLLFFVNGGRWDGLWRFGLGGCYPPLFSVYFRVEDRFYGRDGRVSSVSVGNSPEEMGLLAVNELQKAGLPVWEVGRALWLSVACRRFSL
jgi:hypothetical protein